MKCGCGHDAIDHHGVDHHPMNGGCFGAGSGRVTPKCPCTHTCSTVPQLEQLDMLAYLEEMTS